MAIRAVVFDLDGVVRHFHPSDAADIERRHDLPVGAIATAAFASPLIEAVTTGRITREEWIRETARTVGADAAGEWGRMLPRIDSRMLALSDELRDRGFRTAILTNGTDTIADELALSGIAEHFGEIFNSAEIGYAKPDARAFQYVLEELELGPGEVFFTDDSASKLAGAAALGIVTHHFDGRRRLRRALQAAGVPVSDE